MHDNHLGLSMTASLGYLSVQGYLNSKAAAIVKLCAKPYWHLHNMPFQEHRNRAYHRSD